MRTDVGSTGVVPTPRRTALVAGVAWLLLATAPAVGSAATPGTLNGGFGSGGFAGAGSDTRLLADAVQRDGKIVAAGESGVSSGPDVVVERLTPTGGLDGSFGSSGVAHGPAVTTSGDTGSLARAMAIQADGKIVVAGTATSSDGSARDGILVERFNSNGTIDGGFGSGGVVKLLTSSFGDGYSLGIQKDGKIVVGGTSDTAGSDGVAPRVALARLNTNGSLDSSFGSGGIAVAASLSAYSTPLALAIQSDGKIVVGGSASPGLQVVNALIARFTSTGALDTSFAGSGSFQHQYGIGSAASSFNGLAIQSNGNIVAAGAATNGNSAADAIVARFTPAGGQDTSFGSGGVVYAPSAANTINSSGSVPGANAVALAGNGDIIAAGDDASGLVRNIAVWAFKSSGSPDTSFGTNGVSSTSLGNNVNSEANGLAIGPTGQLLLAGDTFSPLGGSYNGLVGDYNGFPTSVPPPPPPPPTALKVTLTGIGGSVKTSTATRHGLKFTVSCNEPCKTTAQLVVSVASARKLGIKTNVRTCKKSHRKRRCTTSRKFVSFVAASGKATLKGAGSHTFTLKLKGNVARAAGRVKSVGLKLSLVTSSSVTHKTVKSSKNITLRR